MVDAFNPMDDKLLLFGLLPRVCDNIWEDKNFKCFLGFAK